MGALNKDAANFRGAIISAEKFLLKLVTKAMFFSGLNLQVWGITNTGHVAIFNILVVTVPTKMAFAPLAPCVPITT